MDSTLFLKVIDAAPLVFIDLIIRNPISEVLLGKRLNRPVQGFGFVPGGRIPKNERIAEVLERIPAVEIGGGCPLKMFIPKAFTSTSMAKTLWPRRALTPTMRSISQIWKEGSHESQNHLVQPCLPDDRHR